jgi:CheY-like chemotaxis protein
MKVLIVDDEPDLAEAISLLLEMKGHETVRADSGLSGLEAVEEDRFDLILSDIRMPKCDGIQFLEKLRESPSPHPPFLFMTGFSEVTKDEVVAKGAKDILRKPVPFAELLEAVEKYGEKDNKG